MLNFLITLFIAMACVWTGQCCQCYCILTWRAWVSGNHCQTVIVILTTSHVTPLHYQVISNSIDSTLGVFHSPIHYIPIPWSYSTITHKRARARTYTQAHSHTHTDTHIHWHSFMHQYTVTHYTGKILYTMPFSLLHQCIKYSITKYILLYSSKFPQ